MAMVSETVESKAGKQAESVAHIELDILLEKLINCVNKCMEWN